MNIKQIRYFVAVFESGSFSIAAKTCGVAVQAVSKAIHELENGLGEHVFERTNRGAAPTTVGRAFY